MDQDDDRRLFGDLYCFAPTLGFETVRSYLSTYTCQRHPNGTGKLRVWTVSDKEDCTFSSWDVVDGYAKEIEYCKLFKYYAYYEYETE